jgi:hypothetical protein
MNKINSNILTNVNTKDGAKMDEHCINDGAAKDGTTKDNTIEGATKDSTKDGTTKDSTKDGTTKDSTKDGMTKDSTKDGTTKDSTIDGTTKDSTKDGTTKDSTKDGTTKDSTKDGTTKDSTIDGTTKDSTKDGNQFKFSDQIISKEDSPNIKLPFNNSPIYSKTVDPRNLDSNFFNKNENSGFNSLNFSQNNGIDSIFSSVKKNDLSKSFQTKTFNSFNDVDLSVDGKNFFLDNNLTYDDIPILGDLKDTKLGYKDKIIIRRLADIQRNDKEILNKFSLKLNSNLEKNIIKFITEFDNFLLKEIPAQFSPQFSFNLWKKLLLKATTSTSLFSNVNKFDNIDYSLENLTKILLPNKSLLKFKEEFLKIKMESNEKLFEFIDRFKVAAKFSKIESNLICMKFVNSFPSIIVDKIIPLFVDPISHNKDFGENLEIIISNLLNFCDINDILVKKVDSFKKKSNFKINNDLNINNKRCYNCHKFGHLGKNCKFRRMNSTTTTYNNNINK